MNDTKGLLQCPNCQKYGKKQILGRVLENGQFLVLRHHHGTTLIQSTTYSIICGCGWSFDVNCGTVIINQSNGVINNSGQAIQAII